MIEIHQPINGPNDPATRSIARMTRGQDGGLHGFLQSGIDQIGSIAQKGDKGDTGATGATGATGPSPTGGHMVCNGDGTGTITFTY